jgi:hypothetical protein
LVTLVGVTVTRFLLWLIPAVLLGQPSDADAQQVTLRATLQVAALEPYLGVPLVQFRDEVEKRSNKAVIPSSVSFDPSSRTERCEPQASSAPIRDLVRCVSDSPHEVPDSLAALGFRDDGWQRWLAGISPFYRR